MALKLTATKAFERSLKKMKRRGKDLSKIHYVGELLRKNQLLPPHYKNHSLRGNYKGCWECHIEPDWLLVYRKTSSVIILIETGSHSDLF